jgi:hypothetical protein
VDNASARSTRVRALPALCTLQRARMTDAAKSVFDAKYGLSCLGGLPLPAALTATGLTQR